MGGDGTVYSRACDDRVRVLGVTTPNCALSIAPTDFVNEPPAKDAQIGMFIDYVVTRPKE